MVCKGLFQYFSYNGETNDTDFLHAEWVISSLLFVILLWFTAHENPAFKISDNHNIK